MLYACGSNGNGQLGCGHDDDIRDWAVVPIDIEGPVRIAGGGNHTVIVEETSGNAFQSVDQHFKQIPHPQGLKWKYASAGWAFFILVDSENSLWSAGSGSKGELGTNTLENNEVTLIPWTAPEPVVAIESGLAHTVVLLSSGDLYGWGASRKGQAGIEQPVLCKPTRFPTNLRAHSHACGQDFTAVINVDGSVQIWGNNRWLQAVEPQAPLSVVQCGWSTVAIGDKIWGNNSHGQLDMPKYIVIYAMGSEHGLYVTKNGGTVGTWGWGEHGNCPPAAQFSGEIQIFGGCATSFVNTY